jgi:hypothetical protein
MSSDKIFRRIMEIQGILANGMISWEEQNRQMTENFRRYDLEDQNQPQNEEGK